jgi:hypothetical protein
MSITTSRPIAAIRRADGGDGVVHGLQQEPVQVEEVAGYQDG